MAAPGLVATGLWLTATIVSTAIVWTATSTVAEDVTDRPAPVIPHQDVVSELESGASEVPPATTATTRPGPSSSTTQALAPAPTPPPLVTSQPDPAPQPTVTSTPASPPTTAAPSPPTTKPASQPAPLPTATYSTSGGVVRVACDGFFFIRLISATPTDGYAVLVLSRGPGTVDVRFFRSTQSVSVKAFCFGQPVRYEDGSGVRPPSGV